LFDLDPPIPAFPRLWFLPKVGAGPLIDRPDHGRPSRNDDPRGFSMPYAAKRRPIREKRMVAIQRRSISFVMVIGNCVKLNMTIVVVSLSGIPNRSLCLL
jgi:hypothetical protein